MKSINLVNSLEHSDLGLLLQKILIDILQVVSSLFHVDTLNQPAVKLRNYEKSIQKIDHMPNNFIRNIVHFHQMVDKFYRLFNG